MTGAEQIAALKGLLDTALYYARQSQHGRNTDPLHDSSTALWVTQFNALGFDSPNLGFQVFNSTASWRAWAEKFGSAVKDLIGYRETFGYDGHAVSVVDSGVTILKDGIYIGDRTDDPLQGWWVDIAGSQLDSMAVSEGVDWALTPLKEGAEALGGILDYATPLVIVVIVILVLVLAIHLT